VLLTIASNYGPDRQNRNRKSIAVSRMQRTRRLAGDHYTWERLFWIFTDFIDRSASCKTQKVDGGAGSKQALD